MFGSLIYCGIDVIVIQIYTYSVFEDYTEVLCKVVSCRFMTPEDN